jgi:EAL domain-containing protein (putative c-di-GMP-specific phosphodiesterase class I)
MDMLQEMGCQRGQGYLFAKPLSAKDATALMVAQSPTLSVPLTE